MTKTSLKTLQYLAGQDGTPAIWLAHHLWPDSPGWERSKQCGDRGASKGAGMARPAQGVLGRLRKEGLVEVDYSRRTSSSLWRLTSKGRIALENEMALKTK